MERSAGLVVRPLALRDPEPDLGRDRGRPTPHHRWLRHTAGRRSAQVRDLRARPLRSAAGDGILRTPHHAGRQSAPRLFIDHSIRADTHAWNFGDGATSTAKDPAHIFTAPGTYTVTLTVTGVGGSDTARRTITVLPSTARTGGYVLDGFGGLQPFRIGSAFAPPAAKGAPYWQGWDIARGAAVLPDGSGGYTLDGFGGLHPFRIGSSTTPPKVSGAPYWKGWDAARGVALMPKGNGGYMVDLFGGIHRFRIGSSALPPKPTGSPYWNGQDQARGIAILGDGTGGYVVDRSGNLHAFRIGAHAAPPAPTGVWNGSTRRPVQGVSLLPTGTGGYTVDGFGILHRFTLTQTPKSTSGGPAWLGWDIGRDVAVMPGN
ncbi:MAG: PKD domain-containing protein [Acidimicrobiia bacterium]|nr:PKD domain-containing protein [Acidimicrobiia bacterium]